jgi:hypothetical protein
MGHWALAGIPAVAIGLAPADRRLAAVEGERAHCVDRLRPRADPPVDQVEVVGGLVHEQPAGHRLLAVPPAEVVGPVAGVERPGEVDQVRGADRAAGHELAEPGVGRRVPVVEGDREAAPGPLNRRQDLRHLGLVGGHRFFRDHVAAVLHGRHDVTVMVGVHGGDNDHVGTLPADEAGEVAGRVGRHRWPAVPAGQPAVVVGHPDRAGVAQGDEIAVPGVGSA